MKKIIIVSFTLSICVLLFISIFFIITTSTEKYECFAEDGVSFVASNPSIEIETETNEDNGLDTMYGKIMINNEIISIKVIKTSFARFPWLLNRHEVVIENSDSEEKLIVGWFNYEKNKVTLDIDEDYIFNNEFDNITFNIETND